MFGIKNTILGYKKVSSTVKVLLFLFVVLVFQPISGQSDFLGKNFHKGRRDALRALMPHGAVAVFFSAEIKNRSNDVDYRYHQDPDFFYLTGIKEPNSVLIVYKDSVEIEGVRTNEVLFIEARNKYKELWNGKMLGVEGAAAMGFANVYPISKHKQIDLQLKESSQVLSLLNEEARFTLNEKYPALIQEIEVKSRKLSLSDLMNLLRETKTDVEIQALRKAIEISCIGQRATMKALTPDMTEMEAQGIHEFVFKKNGCQEVGYPSIVGAGNNGCVLHYIENDEKLEDGELILMDVGAEFEGYSADVTRTIPVNGKFSEEQKIIYNIVKKAQEAGFEECEVGNSFRAPHVAAAKVISKELKKLGLIKSETEVRKYFPHGTSHYLGLDVHDRGTFGVFKPNTIITVEPGIYIPEGSDCDKKWWGIGVRIEDDILITEDGWENLSRYAPRSVEEIEALMKEESPLNNFDPALD